MELVYLADGVFPSRYASSIQVMKNCQAFADVGHDVTLIAPDWGSHELDVADVYDYYDVDRSFDVVKCSRPDLSSAGTFVATYRVGRTAARMDPDLAFGRSAIACYVASLHGTPTAFELHSPLVHRRFGRVRQLFLRRLLGHASFEGLVVVSEALRDHYCERFPEIADDVVVARNGADVVDDSVEAASLAGGGDRLQVGYVGHLYEGRGMEVVAELGRRVSGAHFHVVGGNPEEVDHWRGGFCDLDNVTLYGFVRPGEVDRYRVAFDVQLAPYQWNLKTDAGYNPVRWMSPLKIFEYMAAGGAIVASDLPAIREILTDGETALLCDPEDHEAWVHAVRSLRDDPDRRRALGDRAGEVFLAEYTRTARARRILAETSAGAPSRRLVSRSAD